MEKSDQKIMYLGYTSKSKSLLVSFLRDQSQKDLQGPVPVS